MTNANTIGAGLIEASQIDGLLEVAGVDGTQDILAAFWRSTRELLARLEDRLGADDTAEAARIAHALKGSAANVGALLLSLAARTMENGCKSGDLAAARTALGEANAAFEGTKRAFDERIKAFAHGG